MKHFAIWVVLFISILLFPFGVEAQQGCCSWHGGIDYCDTSSGRYVCNDGSYSPTCTCAYSPPTTQRQAPKVDQYDPMEYAKGAAYFTANSDGKTYNIRFDWNDLVGVTGYSIAISKVKGADPGPKSDTEVSNYTFEKILPGDYYINMKGLYYGTWTRVYHWDVSVPEWKAPVVAPIIATSQPKASTTHSSITGKEQNDTSDDTWLGIIGSVLIATLLVGWVKWGFWNTVSGIFSVVFSAILLIPLFAIPGLVLHTGLSFLFSLIYEGFEASQLNELPFLVGSIIITGSLVLTYYFRTHK